MQGLPLGGALPNSRTASRAALGCACAVTVAASAACHNHFVVKKQRLSLPFKPQLPRPVIDAIAGAVGEFGQILLLYPVETVKVRCQTEGISARAVMAQLFKQAAQPGGVATVMRALYSGIGASAVLSMAVGAVHWLSFCAAKRAALEALTPPSSTAGAAAGAVAGAAALAASTSKSHDSSAASGQHQHHLHISSLHHTHEEDVQADNAAPQASTSRSEAAASSSGKSGAAAASAAGAQGSGAAAGAAEAEQNASEELARRMKANVIAAAFGAIATALVESPVELFRHQAQAGLISGNLVQEMGSAVRRHGPGALWFGFLPFLLEAFPYDVSELATYSQLRDLHTEAQRPSSRFHGVVSCLPTHAWDAAMGAAAGAAAVIISMPLDVVKTYVQTHASGHVAASPMSQVSLFFKTGQTMVQQRGMRALFVGMVPRLLQQVPSSTICWWSVEACQKALEPFAAPGSPPAGGGH